MASSSPPNDRDPVASLHLAPLIELASGVDALYLSGSASVPDELLAELEHHRGLAEAESLPVPFELGGECFGVTPRAWGHYRYCLEHPHGRVGFSTSKHLPAIRIQPRSAYLHTVGPAEAVARFARTLSTACDDVTLNVSRLDLYADFDGWDLGTEDRSRFRCRASSVRTYEVGGRLTGFEFGRRSSKTITARVYDKTADVARTGAAWWFDLWQQAAPLSGPVRRVEFELNRACLTQFGVWSPDKALAAVGDIWRYCTTEWLTHRSPTADTNVARWPTSAEWTSVQQARLAQRTIGAERIKGQLRCRSLRTLMPGLTGYVVSFAALSGTTGIDDTMAALGHRLNLEEMATGVSVSERIRRRKLEDRFR